MTVITTGPTIRVVHWTEIAWEPHYRTPHHEGEEARATAQRKGLVHDRHMDRKTEARPWMNQLMDQALLRISMCSDGATTHYRTVDMVRHRGPRTSDQAPAALHAPAKTTKGGESQAPTSGLADDIRRLETMYTRSRTHSQRLHVIRAAQAIGMRMVKMDRSLVRGTPEWRSAIASASGSVREVAARYGVNHTTVSRIKRAAGTNARPGRPVRNGG